MAAYRYEKIDAFTAKGSLGNPAACLFPREDQTLSDEQMQEIAAAHKGFVSEVVYCREIDRTTYSLRYFSSECEVDFCGHGTIACMYSLINGSSILRNMDMVTIQTKNATLPVYNRILTDNAVYVAAPEPAYHDISLSDSQISTVLGIDPGTLNAAYPVLLINAGLNTLIVPVAGLETEVSMFPDEPALKAFCVAHGIDIVLTWCFSVQDDRHFAHTRVFAAKFGYLEDPATGSGNSAFGYYLLQNKLWNGGNIAIEQGGRDRVYNTVRLTCQSGRVLFGGGATTRIRGEYFLEGGRAPNGD